ncbi:MAG TPA: DUF397 domain-containing protein [Actinokineospora sp.]|nr:DUF397 domain-containing protein [Actinokineospora sp.]
MTQGKWRKSSFSDAGQSACVEVALTPDLARLRDSKNAGGPTLAVSPTAWTTFLTRIA